MSGKIRCPGRGNHFHSKLLIFSMLSNKGHLKYYRVPPNHFLIHTHARLSQLPLLPLLSVSELLQLLFHTEGNRDPEREGTTPGHTAVRGRARTKPRISELLSVGTFPAYFHLCPSPLPLAGCLFSPGGPWGTAQPPGKSQPPLP